MANTTYGYINCPGSGSDYMTTGPYLAGAIVFIATRASNIDPQVTIQCRAYMGFGSYSNAGSYTGNTITANFWHGSNSWSNASSGNKRSATVSSGSWTRSGFLTRLTTDYASLTAQGYSPKSTSLLSFDKINWTSGSKTFFIYTTGGDSYQAKSVTVACPAYHPNVTISYNANGGTGAPAPQTKQYGVDLTLSSQKPSRSGYNFIGWASTATATEWQWQPEGNLHAEGTRTLYAIWEPASYKVTYESNGGSSDSMDDSTNITYNTNFTPKANTFSKTGHSFARWNTIANGTGDIWNAGEAKTWLYTENKTFYAQWNANSYTLTIRADNATIPAGPDWTGSGTTVTKTLSYDAQYGNLPTPTRSGYNFKGWYTSSSGGTPVSSITTMGTGATIYAQWTSAQYTVSYNMNGGSGTAPATQTFYPGQSITLSTISAITKTKNNVTYTATGWNTQAGENQSASTFFTSGYNPFNEQSATFNSNNQLTLYVHWRGATYTVSYNKNTTDTVSNMPSNSSSITAPTTYTIPSTRPSRSGYTFTGWGTQSSGGTIYQPGEIYNQNNTVILYAQWTEFKITFDSTYLQDYNQNRNQVAFGIKAADGSFNSHSGGVAQGIYTTGIYIKSKILDEYGTGVISGQLLASTVELALVRASYSSGIMGSINITSQYSNNSITVPIGWYNYIYVPHRNGGINGVAQSDNCNYGSMLLFGMNNSNGIFRIKRDSSEIEKFYTTLNKPSVSDIGAVPEVGGKVKLFNSRQTDANLTADGKTGLSHFLATNSMTSNKPADGDGHIIHMAWDNTGGWDNQLYVRNGNTPTMAVRGQSSGTWGSWKKVYTEQDSYIRSSTGGLDWGDGSTKGLVITKGALAYWNGSYDGTSSRLSKCSAGTIIGTSTSLGKTTFTPTSGSSYSNYGGCYYEKYGRVVHIHVGVSGLSTGVSTNIYTLPSGYRPSSPVYTHGTGGAWNNIGYMEISTAGVVTVRSQGTYCGADITFLA